MVMCLYLYVDGSSQWRNMTIPSDSGLGHVGLFANQKIDEEIGQSPWCAYRYPCGPLSIQDLGSQNNISREIFPPNLPGKLHGYICIIPVMARYFLRKCISDGIGGLSLLLRTLSCLVFAVKYMIY